MRREKKRQECSQLLWRVERAPHIEGTHITDSAVNLKYAVYLDLVLSHAVVKSLKTIGNAGFNVTALQYSTIQYSTVQYSTVQYSTSKYMPSRTVDIRQQHRRLTRQRL